MEMGWLVKGLLILLKILFSILEVLIIKKIKGSQPISLVKNNLLLYKSNKFYLYNDKLDSYEYLFQFNTDLKTKLIGKSRLLTRLFRKDIKSYVKINNEEFFLSFNKKIFYVSLKKKTVTKVFDIPVGFSEPLNYCIPLQGNPTFKIFFGDYGNNSERECVSVYGIDKELTVKKVYTFKKGDIRHIHNIIPDKYKYGYYIFTGDNEEKAGIYWSNSDFSVVKPVFIGDQRGRAVAGFVTSSGLLYAMDSISEKNYIWLLTEKDGETSLKKIGDLNGSVIYSTKYLSGYLLSTTVESPERTNNSKLSLFSVKRGKGILSNEVQLVYVDEKFDVVIFKQFKKDKLPYKLFQYGAVKFPSGLESSETLVVYPTAVRKDDGDTLMLDGKKLLLNE
ncbi:hypothetical protein [Tetragenococcus halophilus]|uniref:hypothetical protein n=1 Tax=Tetragenococcus halophilus TaxID=51669 RepID=UPI00209B7B14|nr:hypothetical protein [Tetragenococcus halophilus]MCO8291378.1 hypothetical protein [Tetragenococcus halophilus]